MKSIPWILHVLTTAMLYIGYKWYQFSEANDPYKCNAGLSTGNITGEKAITCIGAAGEKQNIFIGDSTVREGFWGVARQLNKKAAVVAATKAEKHADITFTEGRTTLEFIWDPYWNSSRITQYLGQSQANAKGTVPESDKGIVVIGGGLWFAIEEQGSVEQFQDAVNAIIGHLPPPDVSSKGLHRPLLMPVQPPYYEKLDEVHTPTTTADKIDAMNSYLSDLAEAHDIDFLSSFLNMVENAPATAYEPKGFQVMPVIADKQRK